MSFEGEEATCAGYFGDEIGIILLRRALDSNWVSTNKCNEENMIII